MSIYLGNTEIGKELVDSYELGNVYLGANQIGFGSNGDYATFGLIGNFNTWNNASYPQSGSTWDNLASVNENLTLINSPEYSQVGGYFPNRHFTFTTSSYATGSIGVDGNEIIMLQAWVNTDGDDSGNTYEGAISIGDYGVGSEYNYLGMGVRTDGKVSLYLQGQTATRYTALNSLNQWVNIAVSLTLNATNTVLKVYFNGIKIGERNDFTKQDYQGNGNFRIKPQYSNNFKCGFVIVSNNAFGMTDQVIYDNYFATKQYFGY